MCYDISFKIDLPLLSQYFPELFFDLPADYHFGPIDHVQGVSLFGEHPVIYRDRKSGKLTCKMMEWSCIEYFQKVVPDFKKRNGMLNIRSERVLDDPRSYWHKIRNRRCLIPVTGIYEHRTIAGWKKKVPYLVRPADQSVFFLPGLYSVAHPADPETGEVLERWTFGLMTRGANGLMKQIHNEGENKWRMPLFLHFDQSQQFLNDELSDEAYRSLLNYEMPSSELSVHPVYTIRSPKLRPDALGKDEPWEWDNLPALEG